jgi:hypothetical protein
MVVLPMTKLREYLNAFIKNMIAKVFMEEIELERMDKLEV